MIKRQEDKEAKSMILKAGRRIRGEGEDGGRKVHDK
jgi:hypothetical protein